MRFPVSQEVRSVRKRLGHPVIDADGHFVPFMPLLEDLLKEVGGPTLTGRLARFRTTRRVDDADAGFAPIRSFWGFPAENTVDRATSTLPKLMYDRLDQVGIDFALLFPTGLAYLACPDDELRQATMRAYNEYVVQMYGEFRDRLEPAAMIPTFTPEEAIVELDHAVGVLGLKAVVMTGAVPRAVRPSGERRAWVDSLGHDSLYDYDPVWQRCAELGVVPTFHGVGYGWGSRVSSTNYVHNHLGNFAAAQEAVCRALVMGGAVRRFPDLPFAFLEGGVTWGLQLFSDLLGHYEKRNGNAIGRLDPLRLDPELCAALFDEFAHAPLDGYRASYDPAPAFMRVATVAADETVDDFAESGLGSSEDIVDVFRRQLYFGCEADDPLNALAFDTRIVPGGRGLRAMFASDIGHWDVTDMRDVLPEAWELVDRGCLTEEDFRAFTYGNVHDMLTTANPAFFAGTVIEGSGP